MRHTLMHLDDFSDDMRLQFFEYFYWFSRFEFALKENGYIREGQYGVALPDWNRYRDDFSEQYESCPAAALLLDAPPLCQMYENHGYRWEVINLNREQSQLGKVILVLKAIRNNLFHGGKHSQDDWDEPERNIFLLQNGKVALDAVAVMGPLYGDYLRYY